LDRNGLKRSESGFDTNETNPFLSILIHFRLLGRFYAHVHTKCKEVEYLLSTAISV